MIPPFNLSGVLPPYIGSSPADRAGLSPYDASLLEIADAFGTTHQRARILRGLVDLRDRLRQIGVSGGYQWCAGSFCEDIETTQGRSPVDIDVVTFFVRPAHVRDDAAWRAFVAANAALFDASRTKAAFLCDAYFVDASSALTSMISQVTYWHGLFGHQRSSHLWKGILRVPLVSNDTDALALLASRWP